jgi:hypothetical protein
VWCLAACGRVGFDPRAGDATSTADTSATFVDGFDVPDANTIGNGWIEKRASVFGVTNQQAVRLDFSTDYRDNVVYRPAAEDLLDTEVSIEFTPAHLPPGYPQVFARLQQSTVTTANTLDGYIFYIDGDTTHAKITRQAGQSLPPALTTFTFTPALVMGATYRLRLRVTGTAPVQLDGFVEQGSGGMFTIIGQGTATDSGAGAYVTAGATAFSAGVPEAAGYYTYDNFTRTPL